MQSIVLRDAAHGVDIGFVVAGLFVAERLTGQAADVVLDLVDVGPHLLGWGDPVAAEAVARVQACQVAVFASPTYKGAYTGLLKLFLDQIPSDGLNGVVAFPLMLGAALGHAMAPDLLLKPVLVELGAACPARARYSNGALHRSSCLSSFGSRFAVISPRFGRGRRPRLASVMVGLRSIFRS